MTKEDQSELIKYAVIGLGGVLLFKYIGGQFTSGLTSLFGGEDKAQTNDINKEILNKFSAFLPNFYKSAPMGSLLLTRSSADSLVNKILKSTGFFSDDFSAVLAVFRQLKTQSQVSFLSDRFQAVSGSDLLTWLVGSVYPNDRYSAEQVNQLINIVKMLPKYK